ncbi:MAG: very short patch repair endonuclease [Candidatus Nealsonbacteria bacterium DGGOD1a]|nr:MAG: very short patch repair endonuclease [Candidatus Nealsonbacteria bacterium DGGOD1a]
MDKFSKEKRSSIMSRIHSSNTDFEQKIFREVSRKGIKFKKNYKKVIGKPDIALLKFQKAVFLHSDFWHGWQLSRWESVLPNEFWKNKLRKNKLRDRFVAGKLRKIGWQVLTIWEHQIKSDFNGSVNRIISFLKDSPKRYPPKKS